MHQRAQEFADEARERYGFDVDAHEFPEGTKTAADAADAIGCDVAQIASSLVFLADGVADATEREGGDAASGDPVVVVTSGANRASEAKIAAVVDADDVRMAEPDEVKDATGWSIGGVPPFCHDRDLRVLFDETLADHNTVWAAAGTPEAVFPIDPGRLVEIADAEVADVVE